MKKKFEIIVIGIIIVIIPIYLGIEFYFLKNNFYINQNLINFINYTVSILGFSFTIYTLIQIKNLKKALLEQKVSDNLIDMIKMIDEFKKKNWGDEDGDINKKNLLIFADNLLDKCNEIENYKLPIKLELEKLEDLSNSTEMVNQQKVNSVLRDLRKQIDKLKKEINHDQFF